MTLIFTTQADDSRRSKDSSQVHQSCSRQVMTRLCKALHRVTTGSPFGQATSGDATKRLKDKRKVSSRFMQRKKKPKGMRFVEPARPVPQPINFVKLTVLLLLHDSTWHNVLRFSPSLPSPPLPPQECSGSKQYFTEVKPLKWDFPTYATKTGLKGRTRRLIKSFHAYKNDLQWLLGQELPSAVKSYVGGLRDKANVDYLHYQVIVRKTCQSNNNIWQYKL